MSYNPKNTPTPPIIEHLHRFYTTDEVPESFREAHITTGYRSPHSSAALCLRSAFQLTNETLNIWTHLIPTLYFVYQVHITFDSLAASPDLHLVPLVLFNVAVAGYPAASAGAHVFNAMSARARHICFIVDYWALSVYGFVSAVVFHAYSPPGIIGDHFVPSAAILTVASFFVSCRSRFMRPGPARKIIRFASFAVPCLYVLATMMCRDFSDAPGDPSVVFYHRRQYVYAAISAFFYCSHAPERWWPGRFDLFGHSHQLFHAATALGSRDQLLALCIDASDRTLLDLTTVVCYVGAVGVVVMATLVVVAMNVARLNDVAALEGCGVIEANGTVGKNEPSAVANGKCSANGSIDGDEIVQDDGRVNLANGAGGMTCSQGKNEVEVANGVSGYKSEPKKVIKVE